jgi:hypothetical protein
LKTSARIFRGPLLGAVFVWTCSEAPAIERAFPTSETKKVRLDMVPAVGLELSARVENKQLTENIRRSKRTKLHLRTQLERNWNTDSTKWEESCPRVTTYLSPAVGLLHYRAGRISSWTNPVHSMRVTTPKLTITIINEARKVLVFRM